MTRLRTLLIVGIPVTLLGQRPSTVPKITVVANRQISIDDALSPHFETFIAINPRQPRQLLATSIVFDRRRGLGSVAYISNDRGATWQRVVLARTDTVTATSGDPIVYFDQHGTAFFGTNESGFTLARSADGGRTWE